MVTRARRPITAAVRRVIRSLPNPDEATRARAELAVVLAQALDAGPAPTALPGIVKELRAVLADIVSPGDSVGRALIESIFQRPHD